ncbi:hypothetical protein D9757_005514 [Collybiopsis confluens]|uniref:Major facilitator superfamily (MFS) profile domain-containing protein n=1 Tax=Collybiopsis confluens TaxID=2823264 RepID=A0A8H5HMH1_9AGAR|nr:hypothetical protein D9757_005514 [Collybiopsis confluens]
MSSEKVQPPASSPDPSILPKVALDDMYEADGSIDAVYQAKARVLNNAIQEIGMGKYQVYLFICAGFGWFADSVWPLITGLILTPVVNEFKFNGPFLTLAANVGLFVGAIVWSFGCDIWGRRWSFNLTLLIAGVFGLAAGGSQNMIALASLIATIGVGVGGNMPVDSAVFLDLVPGTHQWLLTVMSIWWCLGQLFVSLIAWPLITNFSCTSTTAACTRSENMGWRYLLFTLGGITLVLWFIRFFIFRLYESPRYLIGIGKDAEAVRVINEIARFNGKGTEETGVLTVDDLRKAEEEVTFIGVQHLETEPGSRRVLSASSVLGWDHVKALFRTKQLALSTSLLISLWAIIGLASTLYNSFLPFLLQSRGNAFGDGSLYITYRNTFILSIIGVPGAFLAGWAVELPYVGRKGTLAISSGKLFGSESCFEHYSTTTPALSLPFSFSLSTPSRILYSCTRQGSPVPSSSLLPPREAPMLCSDGTVGTPSLIMYGVLYAISPEIFPAKDRGTGNGLVSSATRVFSIIAPIIAIYANLETATPVYISGALIILAGLLALLLPFEPRGKASI